MNNFMKIYMLVKSSNNYYNYSTIIILCIN